MFRSLPVMMYHSISKQPGRLYVSPELFETHCRTLTEKGWRGISLAEAEAYYIDGKKLPNKACLFTFDDGYLDNYVYAEPILRKYGHCGVIFPILDLVEERNKLRPNMEDLQKAPERAAELEDMDRPKPVARANFKTRGHRFCSWNELRHMQEHGVMAAAPHSLKHNRVIVDLSFTTLRGPKAKESFFSIPPYDVPWGMPLFKTDYALSNRGYTINPALFELVKKTVPQNPQKAKAYSYPFP